MSWSKGNKEYSPICHPILGFALFNRFYFLKKSIN